MNLLPCPVVLATIRGGVALVAWVIVFGSIPYEYEIFKRLVDLSLATLKINLSTLSKKKAVTRHMEFVIVASPFVIMCSQRPLFALVKSLFHTIMWFHHIKEFVFFKVHLKHKNRMLTIKYKCKQQLCMGNPTKCNENHWHYL